MQHWTISQIANCFRSHSNLFLDSLMFVKRGNKARAGMHLHLGPQPSDQREILIARKCENARNQRLMTAGFWFRGQLYIPAGPAD